MPRYRVTFVDNTTIVLEREHGDDAKRDARAERLAAITPRRTESGQIDRTDPRIKVASVTRLAPNET